MKEEVAAFLVVHFVPNVEVVEGFLDAFQEDQLRVDLGEEVHQELLIQALPWDHPYLEAVLRGDQVVDLKEDQLV
jgi:hypothetical protein